MLRLYLNLNRSLYGLVHGLLPHYNAAQYHHMISGAISSYLPIIDISRSLDLYYNIFAIFFGPP